MIGKSIMYVFSPPFPYYFEFVLLHLLFHELIYLSIEAYGERLRQLGTKTRPKVQG